MTETTTATTERTMLTITLSGRPTVRIATEDWPVIAHARHQWDDDRHGIRSQATRLIDAHCRVRQHADGRAIVYGHYEHESRWQGESDILVRSGELLPAGASIDAIITAIRSVCADLSEQSGAEDICRRIARGTIADLPAEELL